MKELIAKQVDVFTTQPFCGNPALVITEAHELKIEEMQSIAGEMNSSESTFVTVPESKEAMFRVRFFTPSFEYDLSGHAMIATCFALAEEGKIPLDDGLTTVNFETNVGIVPVEFYFDKSDTSTVITGEPDRISLVVNGVNKGILKKIMINRTINEYRVPEVPVDSIAEVLGVDKSEIIRTHLPVEIVFSGVYQLVVPLLHTETLINMQPDIIKLKLLNQKLGVQTSDIFSLEPIHPDCAVYSRHFSPIMGMWEDMGSGTGASSICAYLLRHGVITKHSITMEQGREIDRLARVMVEAEMADDTVSVKVGGLAVTSFIRHLVLEGDEIKIT